MGNSSESDTFTESFVFSVCNLESLSSLAGRITLHVSIKREYGTSFKIELLMDVEEYLRLTLRSAMLLFGLEWLCSSSIFSLRFTLSFSEGFGRFRNEPRVSCKEISCTMYGGVRNMSMPSWRMLCPYPGSLPGSLTLNKAKNK